MSSEYIFGSLWTCETSELHRHYYLICFITSALSQANLTGHIERVGIENFELLKVLGTGGKENISPVWVP